MRGPYDNCKVKATAMDLVLDPLFALMYFVILH